MTYGISSVDEFPSFDRGRISRKTLAQTAFGVAALTCCASAFVFVLYNHATAPGTGTVWASSEPVPAPISAPAPAPAPAVRHGYYVALLDPGYSLGPRPVPLSESAPLGSDLQARMPPASQIVIAEVQPAPPDALPAPRVAEFIPLPAPRPVLSLPENDDAPRQTLAQRSKPADVAVTTQDKRNLVQKLFGISPKPSESGPALAYAAPDGGIFGNGRSMTPGRLSSFGEGTAVYDISAHTVYLPDGKRLEAHSGLGNMLDDPRHVSVRMRGATPPHVYDLTLRESLFHGVQALRLNPIGGEGAIYGRSGLLAHTYMLGPNGDSNGCVSFRDYNAFLRAYRNGEVKRLAVVSSLN